jgi:hypothetical protein
MPNLVLTFDQRTLLIARAVEMCVEGKTKSQIAVSLALTEAVIYYWLHNAGLTKQLKRNALVARFWRNVEAMPNGCWLWTGRLDKKGYGIVTVEGKRIKPHRFSYELLIGPFPEDLYPDHTCHNQDISCPGGPECLHRRCVNPGHLEPVTRATNVMRGKGITANNRRKTHCIHGHPFNEENTYVPPNGYWRRCRQCRRQERAQKMSRGPGKRRACVQV